MESYHSIYPTRVKRLINYLGNLVRTSYITRLHTYILRSNIIYFPSKERYLKIVDVADKV